MTHPENGKPLWDESRVESLLERYFQREMPAPLREPHPSRALQTPIPAQSYHRPPSNPRANSFAGTLMVAFSSVLMLMVAYIAWDQSSLRPQDAATNSQDHATGNQDSPNGGREADPLEDYRHTGQGPIETRPRIRSVGTEEPMTPGLEKSPFPELDIEVFPLDRESPSESESPKSALPESRQKMPQDAPMPEEGRSLPEAESSPIRDPDEALLEPMLPELRAISEIPGLD